MTEYETEDELQQTRQEVARPRCSQLAGLLIHSHAHGCYVLARRGREKRGRYTKYRARSTEHGAQSTEPADLLSVVVELLMTRKGATRRYAWKTHLVALHGMGWLGCRSQGFLILPHLEPCTRSGAVLGLPSVTRWKMTGGAPDRFLFFSSNLYLYRGDKPELSLPWARGIRVSFAGTDVDKRPPMDWTEPGPIKIPLWTYVFQTALKRP